MRTASTHPGERGAAFLLAAYFTALTLLVLGGMSLQRAITDKRAAELARDLQQGFYLAEAGVDRTLSDLRVGAAVAASEEPFACASSDRGSTDCRVTALSSVLFPSQDKRSGPTLETLYQVNPTSTVTQPSANATDGRSLSTTVSALVRHLETFSGGIVATGQLTAGYRDWAQRKTEYDRDSRNWSYDQRDEPITIHGHIHSSLGEWQTIVLGSGVTVDGNVTIALPNEENDNAYTRLYGNDAGANYDGVVLEDAYFDLPAATVTGEIKAVPVLPPPVTSVALPVECHNERLPWLEVDTEEKHVWNRDWREWETIDVPRHYRVKDGFVDPDDPTLRDLTPKGDGRVVLCLDAINVEKEAQLTFHDPTTVFTSGSWPLDNRGTINVVGSGQNRPDLGLTIVDTGQDNTLFVGNFEGSIYAPHSDVELGPSEEESWGRDWELTTADNWFFGTDYPEPATRKLGFLVANNVTITGTDLDFGVKQKGKTSEFTLRGEPSTSAYAADVDLLMWADREPLMTGRGLSALNTFTLAATDAPPSPSSPSSASTPSGGGGGGGGGKVICTELHRQGYLPDAWWAADMAYAQHYVNADTVAGYHAWAKPTVQWMRRSAAVTQLIRPLGRAWAQHMAYVMGATDRDSALGRLMNAVGIPLNYLLGRCLASPHTRTVTADFAGIGLGLAVYLIFGLRLRDVGRRRR